MTTTSYIALQLTIVDPYGRVLTVVDARPSTFYSYLADTLAAYAECRIHAHIYDAENPPAKRLIVRTFAPSGIPTGSVTCFHREAVLNAVARVNPADSIKIDVVRF